MPQNAQRICPHCSFAYRARQGRCWLCGQPLPPIEQAPLATATLAAPTDGEIAENPYAAPPSSAGGQLTFALSSLFLVVTLAAVCSGVIGLAPGLGVPLAIVSVLALVRTLAVSRHQAEARGLSTGEKVIAFVGSMGIVILILTVACIAFGIAFFIACSAAMATNSNGNSMLIVGMIAGAGLAVLVSVVLFRATWPKRRSGREPKI